MKCAALTSAISQLSCREWPRDEIVPAEVVVKITVPGLADFPNMGDALRPTKAPGRGKAERWCLATTTDARLLPAVAKKRTFSWNNAVALRVFCLGTSEVLHV